MDSDTLILIPARMASTRLPGKPLADIGGLPMIVRVMRRAEEAGVQHGPDAGLFSAPHHAHDHRALRVSPRGAEEVRGAAALPARNARAAGATARARGR